MMNGKQKLHNLHDEVGLKKIKIDNGDVANLQDGLIEEKQCLNTLKVYPKRNRTPSAKAVDCLAESTEKRKSITKSSRKSEISPRKVLFKPDINVAETQYEPQSTTTPDTSNANSYIFIEKVPLIPETTLGKLPVLNSRNTEEVQSNINNTETLPLDPKTVTEVQLNSTDTIEQLPKFDYKSNVEAVQMNPRTTEDIPALVSENITPVQLKPSTTIRKIQTLDNDTVTEMKMNSTTTIMESIPSVDSQNIMAVLFNPSSTTEKLPALDSHAITEIQMNSTTLTENIPSLDSQNITAVRLNPSTTIEKVPSLDSHTMPEIQMNATTMPEDIPSLVSQNITAVQLNPSTTAGKLPALNTHTMNEIQMNSTTMMENIPFSVSQNIMALQLDPLTTAGKLLALDTHTMNEIQMNSTTMMANIPSLVSQNIMAVQLDTSTTTEQAVHPSFFFREVHMSPTTTTETLPVVDFKIISEEVQVDHTTTTRNIPTLDPIGIQNIPFN